jgi:hypothetical protein
MKNENGRPPCERYIPIEVNEALRESWLKREPRRPSVPMEHLLTLNELLSAYHYDSEKQRLFGIHRSDQLLYNITDELLDVAITEMQEEGVTVVGLIFRVIQQALEIYPVLRKQMFGPVLHHARSSIEDPCGNELRFRHACSFAKRIRCSIGERAKGDCRRGKIRRGPP